MLAVPNTTTTPNYTDPGAAVFPPEAGAGTPYTSGFLFVTNNSAFVSLLKGSRQGAANWSPEALVSPTLVPLGTDLNARTPDYIFGVRARDGVAGTHAQVFGALFQQGEVSFVPSGQFAGTVSSTGSFTQPNVTVPTGSILLYGGATAPSGFLLCDGSAVSRTTYATLFGIIGTLYGAGDGSTTFNVPDFRGRMGVGLGTHADVATRGLSDGLAVAARRPKHKHTVALAATIIKSAGTTFFAAGATGQAALATDIQVGPQTGNEPVDSPGYLVANYVIAT